MSICRSNGKRPAAAHHDAADICPFVFTLRDSGADDVSILETIAPFLIGSALYGALIAADIACMCSAIHDYSIAPTLYKCDRDYPAKIRNAIIAG